MTNDDGERRMDDAMTPTTGPMPAVAPWTPQDDYDRGFAAAKREFIDLMRGWRGIGEPDDNTPLEAWNWALHTATEEFIPRVERMRPSRRRLVPTPSENTDGR